MGEQTSQLLKVLRSWCEAQYGRQSEVARTIGVDPTLVARWFAGRRKMTGEQALRVYAYVRALHKQSTESGDSTEPVVPPALAYDPDDSIKVLHQSLENRMTNTVWVRALGDYRHIIVGGPVRDIALKRIIELLKHDQKLQDITARR